MSNQLALKDTPSFLRVLQTYPNLHLNLLALDRWELINRDMVPRAQHVRSKLATEIQVLAQSENINDACLTLAVDMSNVLVKSFFTHDGAMGHEITLRGVKSLARNPKAFDQALEFFFDVATTFLENARSRYTMKLLVERDVVRSYDNVLQNLIAQHFVTTQIAKAKSRWSPSWAISKVEWFQLEFEQRYDGLLSAFGGTALFKDPYLSKTHQLAVQIQRRPTMEMIVARSVGHMLPQELVDHVAQYLHDDEGLLRICQRIVDPSSAS